ncbi:tight adherence protein C [Natronincola peptidivorans]|uniref:Tight adherence protein C n=1 Tax=Natronincola peptidivorans TaxID=426128 RepID=A0A1I0FQ95_9FIRM|nr:type II secretion system F family protein [Natronincola peptidivorans]SET59683.1 tight adherence protein C [Natronincola peptidivorans]
MIGIIILSFLTFFCLFYGAGNIIFANKLLMEARLHGIKNRHRKNQYYINEELQSSFADRIIKPLLKWISTITQRFTPIRKRDIIEKKLLLAGNPWNLSGAEFISLYYAVTVMMGIVVFVIAFLYFDSLFIQLLGFLWGLIFGRLLLDLLLKLKTRSRQMEIGKELPDVLDLLTVSVEAGLGFDAAIKKVVEKTTGPISSEFNKTLQEMKMGKPRRDALKDLTNRTGEEDLNSFIGAIVQADQMGVGIGKVLRVQSKQMRIRRKQKIEEKAMKAPIKMLLPMVFFIFPTIFIVLLGPAVMQIMEAMR